MGLGERELAKWQSYRTPRFMNAQTMDSWIHGLWTHGFMAYGLMDSWPMDSPS